MNYIRLVPIFRLMVIQMAVFCLLLPVANSAPGFPTQSRDSVYAIAKQFVGDQFSDLYKIQLQLGYLDKRLQLARCEQSLEAFFPVRKHPLGATTIGVRCPKPAWKVYVPAQIKAYTKVVTLKQPVTRGAILALSDLAIETREISRFRSGVYKNPNQVAGMMLKHSLAQGSVLTPSAVKPKQLINRGQLVNIIAESGGLAIRVKGEALMDGHHGQTIQVKNIRTGKKLSAEVIALHTVRVKM